MNNNRLNNIFIGFLLILGGGIALAQNLGYLQKWSPQTWIWICAGLSVVSLVMYGLNGVQYWGWLFPGSIFAGVALTLVLAEGHAANALIPIPVLASVGVPFLVAFALAPRKHWWALIPVWTIGIVSAIILVSERVPGEWIAALVLYGIALPFLVSYLLDRNRRWALLPAFILVAIGTLPLFATRLNGQMVGAAVLVMIALPFFFVFVLSAQNWWALIPAGVLASIALEVFLTGAGRYELGQTAIPAGAMFVGWAATFAVLWLQRAKQPTDWAKYPALLCASIAAFIFLSGSGFEKWWPVLLIVAGILLLFASLRSFKGPKQA